VAHHRSRPSWRDVREDSRPCECSDSRVRTVGSPQFHDRQPKSRDELLRMVSSVSRDTRNVRGVPLTRSALAEPQASGATLTRIPSAYSAHLFATAAGLLLLRFHCAEKLRGTIGPQALVVSAVRQSKIPTLRRNSSPLTLDSRVAAAPALYNEIHQEPDEISVDLSASKVDSALREQLGPNRESHVRAVQC
jgi:hypothetical protein